MAQTQKTKQTNALDAAKSSSDALKLFSSPADISKGTVSNAQLQKLLDSMNAFNEYLENKEYLKSDANFAGNKEELLTRTLEIQDQANNAWMASQDDARFGLYADILVSAKGIIEKASIISVVPHKIEERVPHDVSLPSGEMPKAYFTTQAAWKVEKIDSLPARTATFLSKGEEPRAKELIADILTPHLNYRNATSDAERSLYAKQMAKAAPALIEYLEKANPGALGAMICGRGTDCSATISALKKGDPKAIEKLLQQGNSPLAEFMDDALETTGGTYTTSVVYLALHPSARVLFGETSYLEMDWNIIGSRKITETKGRGGSGSSYEEKNEFRFSPELNLGTKLTIPPGSDSRLKMGMEGGVGVYNPYYLKKGKYIVGVRAGYSLDYDANLTDEKSVAMNIKVEGKHGIGDESFTELVERSEMILMLFQFGKGSRLGVVARADAMQLFADSFSVPLYGINADAGLAYQLIRYKDQGGTVNIYFAGGYTHKLNKLKSLPWESTSGGFFQLNTGKEGRISGGLDLRIYEPAEIRGLPKSKSPWQVSVGGTLGLHF